MMDLMKYLSHITTVPGTSGYEAQVAEEFARLFAPLCDEVNVDQTQSMIGVQRGRKSGPRVMLCAHIDEVGLMTTGVEEDGSVRFLSLGVAAQTLPAQEVTILAKDGPAMQNRRRILTMPFFVTKSRSPNLPISSLFAQSIATAASPSASPATRPVSIVPRSLRRMVSGIFMTSSMKQLPMLVKI